jgi:hypothetical protein
MHHSKHTLATKIGDLHFVWGEGLVTTLPHEITWKDCPNQTSIPTKLESRRILVRRLKSVGQMVEGTKKKKKRATAK